MIHDTKVTLLLAVLGIAVATWYGTQDLRGVISTLSVSDEVLENVKTLDKAIDRYQVATNCVPDELQWLVMQGAGRQPPPNQGCKPGPSEPTLAPDLWTDPRTGDFRLPAVSASRVEWARPGKSLLLRGLGPELAELVALECRRVIRRDCVASSEGVIVHLGQKD
jgi:hypothetical protein